MSSYWVMGPETARDLNEVIALRWPGWRLDSAFTADGWTWRFNLVSPSFDGSLLADGLCQHCLELPADCGCFEEAHARWAEEAAEVQRWLVDQAGVPRAKLAVPGSKIA